MAAHGRDELIRRAMEYTNWDLLVCGLPSNVLLLTGYWPAGGHSLASVTRDGQILLIAPEYERDLAEHSWADEVLAYPLAPLDRMLTGEESLYESFSALKRQCALSADRIGFEQADGFEPAGYSPHQFRGTASRIVRRAFPSATLAPADEMLAQLRATKTPAEIVHIRRSCRLVERGFQEGARLLRPGLNEVQAAAALRLSLSTCAEEFGSHRCESFVYCASGENSVSASGPLGRSRARPMGGGELVICQVHCHSDGYWADVVRTWHIGPLDAAKRALFDAVFAARDAALSMIRPGARAADVDRAAREELHSRGFGAAFPHPAGHGAGFSAADYSARPRLHPKSEDMLEPGMVLKLEPGVYVEGIGGVRNADMLAVTENGADVLTPFQWDTSGLQVLIEEELNAL